MQNDNRISCRDIAKRYPDPPSMKSLFGLTRSRGDGKRILGGVSFEVAPGEIFGIVGPNGAGKTTIMKILSHLTSPTSGEAVVCGFDVEREWRSALRCIGYCISEERSFFWRLSGRENLRFFADLFEVPPEIARPRIDELFKTFDLQDAADERFMNYSSGMKQKMAIARSLLADPQVLLMDEPTRGLDPRAAARLREFLADFVTRRGKAAVVTTNQVSDIEHLCHRIAILNRGRIVAQGTIPEIGTTLAGLFERGEKPSFEEIFDAVLERDDPGRGREGRG